MAARSDYCRHEPNLEELLDDEMMESVLRSAGFDSRGFREMIAETASRFDYLGARQDPRVLNFGFVPLKRPPSSAAAWGGAPAINRRRRA